MMHVGPSRHQLAENDIRKLIGDPFRRLIELEHVAWYINAVVEHDRLQEDLEAALAQRSATTLQEAVRTLERVVVEKNLTHLRPPSYGHASIVVCHHLKLCRHMAPARTAS